MNNLLIERTHEPMAVFARHTEELSAAGADAFGQPAADFAPQVAERLARHILPILYVWGSTALWVLPYMNC